MKQRFCLALILCFVTNLAIWAPNKASASLVVGMSLQDMANAADVIAVGRIGAQYAEYTAQGLIVTRTELQVSESIKGQVSNSTCTISTLGGQVGDLGMHVEGTPQFVNGEQVVLFLSQSSNSELAVVGMSQGAQYVHRVNGIDYIEQRLQNVGLVGRQAALAQPVRLSTFLAQLRSLVSGQKRGAHP